VSISKGAVHKAQGAESNFLSVTDLYDKDTVDLQTAVRASY